MLMVCKNECPPAITFFLFSPLGFLIAYAAHGCLATVLLAKSDSDFMFCLQSYQGLILDRSLVYHILILIIALDTRLLAQVYRPSQIELSSPGIQKSSRGLIRRLIPGLIFFSVPPSPAVDLALEKKQGISAK